MLDKILTLLLVGSFVGLIGYNVGSIFSSRKTLFKSIIFSSLAALFVGIVNINMVNIGSILLSLPVNDAKSPLLYAALGALIVSIAPLEGRKLGFRSEKPNLLGRSVRWVREV